MKIKSLLNLTIAAGLTMTAVQLQAQTKPKTVAKKTTTNTNKTSVPTIKPFQLTNLKDSLSYALGVDIANSLKQSGFELNTLALTEALNKHLADKEILIEEEQTSAIISSAMIAMRAKPGRDFLAENKKNPAVKVTPEGLQYEVLVEGEGAYPMSSDEVVVHYKGTLIDGEKFDSSYDRNAPLTLNLDRVIEGWKLGIPLMRIGSKYKFYIPYELAYGERATGAIPAFSTLIFEVELLGVKKSSEI